MKEFKEKYSDKETLPEESILDKTLWEYSYFVDHREPYYYHATFAKNLESIKKDGLLTTPPQHYWDVCEGVIFLSDDKDCAESHCEVVESPNVSQEDFDNIVVLKIHSGYIGKFDLFTDPYTLIDENEKPYNFVCKCDLPPESVVNLDEELNKFNGSKIENKFSLTSVSDLKVGVSEEKESLKITTQTKKKEEVK